MPSFTASLSQSIGDASLAGEVSYARAQDTLGGLDNLYLGVSGEVPIKKTPLTLHGSFGWEDGAYGDGKLDWSLGTRFDLANGIAHIRSTPGLYQFIRSNRPICARLRMILH